MTQLLETLARNTSRDDIPIIRRGGQRKDKEWDKEVVSLKGAVDDLNEGSFKVNELSP